MIDQQYRETMVSMMIDVAMESTKDKVIKQVIVPKYQHHHVHRIQLLNIPMIEDPWIEIATSMMNDDRQSTKMPMVNSIKDNQEDQLLDFIKILRG